MASYVRNIYISIPTKGSLLYSEITRSNLIDQKRQTELSCDLIENGTFCNTSREMALFEDKEENIENIDQSTGNLSLSRSDSPPVDIDFSKNTSCSGKMYLLPKIHKRLNDVPGCPVISNCGTPTENLSEFLDHHLQPIIKARKSYIKDTSEKLKKIF